MAVMIAFATRLLMVTPLMTGIQTFYRFQPAHVILDGHIKELEPLLFLFVSNKNGAQLLFTCRTVRWLNVKITCITISHLSFRL